MFDKINIHKNKKLHRALSHFSAYVLAAAALLGMFEATQDTHRIHIIAQKDYAFAQAGENEIGHMPVNFGSPMRSASTSGRRD